MRTVSRILFPLLFISLPALADSAGAQEIQIDAPLSGWRAAEGDNAAFSQSVNYPASTVNMASD